MIAEIIPEIKTWHDTEVFSYRLDDELAARAKTGSIASIPFGRRNIRGIVVSVRKETKEDKIPLKNVVSIDNNFVLPEKYIEISKFVSHHYFCSLGEAVSLFLPPDMKRPRKQLKVESEKLKVIRTTRLSKEQQDIFEKLKKNLTSKMKKPALIHGVTGSGKTEIYLKLAEEVITAGKQVIVLVPEIMLTPQTVERFEAVFGDQVCLMHSNLSKSERYNCYQNFYSGAKSIIVGPRSALLVPSDNIGLIIIDEEQEDSYKQDMSPRYHAVILSQEIAKINDALLVLGSATPRVETYYKTNSGQFDLFELNNRFNNAMPTATVIDLKDEIKYDNYSPISRKLLGEMSKVLSSKRQVLLFMNRRGSATFVSCRDCGHVMLCQNCSIPMVYHVNANNHYLNCHHCDSKMELPTNCPNCNGFKIKYFGTGIDKIETEIRKLFPAARIAKVDSTTISKKADYDHFFQKFKKHELDIVIGTQMIAKGLDIPDVDLVGIVSADTGLHLPHYLATEKSFDLLTQVSGRSGRSDGVGQTVIQTYWPDSRAIVAAQNHDYRLFYDLEILERQKYNYPPFVTMVRVISENKKQEKAKEEIEMLAKKLEAEKYDFIGPGACFYARLHDKFRYHIIIKEPTSVDPAKLALIVKNNPQFIWDTEPVNLL